MSLQPLPVEGDFRTIHTRLYRLYFLLFPGGQQVVASILA